MNITIYTTSKSKWYRDEAKEVEKAYANFFPLTFTFIDINEPTPVFKIDKDGDKVLDWDWFTKTFPAKGACFHFNKKFAIKWKIALGGQRNSYSKESPQFWVTADREGTEGYTFSNFRRLLFHESAHFWEDVDNETGNALIQSSVHNFDYKLKQIHKYHELVNFKAYQASIVTSLEAKKSLLVKMLEGLKKLVPQEKKEPFLKGDFRITQAFGEYNPIYSQTQHHLGTDFATPLSTLIYAPLSGKLTRTVGKETGVVATLETKQGTYQFLHLGHCAPDGQYEQGHVIGYTGNSGSKTTGPHVCVRLWVGVPNIAILTKDNFTNYLKDVTK